MRSLLPLPALLTLPTLMVMWVRPSVSSTVVSLAGLADVGALMPAWQLSAIATGARATTTASVPLALAFGAGVLAVFNPCGFALLPAFVSYTVGSQVAAPGGQRGQSEPAAPEAPAAPAAPSVVTRLLYGLGLGVPLTAGFLLVFLVAGGLLAVGGRALAQVFPWLGLVVGLALIGMGVRLLLPGAVIEAPLFTRLASALAPVSGGKKSPSPRASAATSASSATEATCCDEEGGTRKRRIATAHVPYSWQSLHRLRVIWGFGLGYGLSSLGCSLPVFLLVVGTAIAAGGPVQAALVFMAYGVGMAVVLLGVALVAASLGDVLRQGVQRVLPLLRWVQPVSALLILAAGVYIVVYQVQAGLLIH